MKRARLIATPRLQRNSWQGYLWLALLTLACQGQSSTPSEGSNSNWLIACSGDSECGAAFSCRCGGCSRECDSDADCDGFADARCSAATENARASQCRTRDSVQSFGICLPRCEAGSCNTGQACIDAACVLMPWPDSEFCAALTWADAEQRVRQDELLQLLNETRAAGGVSCGGNPPAVPAPALRLDGRLVCAARVLATDLNATGMRSLLDSQGRSSQQRFTAAGYTSRRWGEGFAMQASSPSDALASMLADEDSCLALIDPDARDAGAAWVGDVDVLSLAAD
jgi:hypothetical protein